MYIQYVVIYTKTPIFYSILMMHFTYETRHHFSVIYKQTIFHSIIMYFTYETGHYNVTSLIRVGVLQQNLLRTKQRVCDTHLGQHGPGMLLFKYGMANRFPYTSCIIVVLGGNVGTIES